MLILTDEEIARWLEQHSIQANPYSRNYHLFGGGYQQRPIPESGSRVAFSESLIRAEAGFSSALLHFTDWSGYRPEDMAAICAIRAEQGEQRWLIEAPGHLFVRDQADELIRMFGLAMEFGWTAYLYFETELTYLAWEGELLDEWRIAPGQRGFSVPPDETP
ncbi:hypothetical protein [Haloferula sp. BvORR071]|uniref:hypothetical protein n=1 Tax=Haloferula sp. BvORR071 TaxID=1396141 RepID=UPI000555C304|nr:hypothetical protein [Haloferula sp. BvORR071]